MSKFIFCCFNQKHSNGCLESFLPQPFFRKWQVKSFYLKKNRSHTNILLDFSAHEQTQFRTNTFRKFSDSSLKSGHDLKNFSRKLCTETLRYNCKIQAGEDLGEKAQTIPEDLVKQTN